MSLRSRDRIATLIVTAVALLVMLFASGAQAQIAPEITDTTPLNDLGELTNFRFAPNGEVFAIDKEGQIFDYPSLAEPHREVIVADLSNEVMDYKDRGMLGLAVDPQYPTKPYIYVLYAYDAPPGETAPRWPKKSCPVPPGPGPETAEGGDGCVVTGRLSRITIDLSTHKMVGEEKPLVKDWCQQFTSHSVDDLVFGPEGALYASGGTGGAYNLADWGQLGGTLPNAEHPIVPNNPCGDPTETSGAGSGTPGVTKEEIETAEGGVLRSQSFNRPLDQPATLDGTIARIDPENGDPLPSNPNISAADIDRQRIVAFGLRQPFRFTFRPGTEELWVGDVGESKWEEIDRDTAPLKTPSVNFGWPCYEGANFPYEYGVEYEKANLCKQLYLGGSHENTAVDPYYAYNHGEDVLPGDECPYRGGTGPQVGASTSGLAFVSGGPWPAAWNGALFFADITRDCIWSMMPATPGGLPEPTSIKTIESLSEGKGAVCYKEAALTGCAVDMERGPEGDIYYADGSSGTIHRLSYEGYPVAVIGVSAATVHAGSPFVFTGEKSTSPDPGSVTYHWDFGDSTGASSANATHVYSAPGTYTATLTVTDTVTDKEDTSSVKVTVLKSEPLIAPEIRDTTVIEGGLGELTNVRFAPNGEVFAINKEGKIFNYPSLAEPTRRVEVADLSTEVMDYEDRGLLGLAIDPHYPVRPYIYVLYAYNALPGGVAPRWPSMSCPYPPGAGPEIDGGDGCVITGRLSRITVDPSTHLMVGEEKPLIKDQWCQQFTSHSIGDLQFGPEGALYASGGSGGAFNVADWGQYGGTLPNKEHPIIPSNPCGDPNENSGAGPGTPGVTTEEPVTTAEGGVLRSQSFRRPANQPATLDGTIARIDPENGDPLPSNPNISAGDINRQRTVAYGLRNPFRFTFRPGTEEVWIGDVGENTWEEIDRDTNPLSKPSANFGWPCFEGGYGVEEQLPYEYGTEYEKAELCKKLYKGGAEEKTAVKPYYDYKHNEAVTAGDECPYRYEPAELNSETGSSTTGLAFLHGGPWPAAWDGALFMGDVTRDCIWAMMPETPGGLPKQEGIKSIESLSAGKGVVCELEAAPSGCPVDMELGPEGDIYYADINSGTIHRLSYEGYPAAVIGVSAAMVHAGSSFAFTGDTSTSSDPGSTTYHWDFGDSTSASSANATHVYSAPGTYTATLTVTDTLIDKEDTSSVKVTVLEPEPPAKKEEPAPPAKEPAPPASLGGTPISAPLVTALTEVKLTPTRFRTARTATLRAVSGKGSSAVGATLHFNISQKASVKLMFSRGVRVGKSLRYKSISARGVAPICSGHGHRRKCRTPSSDRIVVMAGAGANSIVLSGWVGGAALPPGSYTVTLQATGASLTVSAPVVAHFTILAPAKAKH